jgi:hypothetical protein
VAHSKPLLCGSKNAASTVVKGVKNHSFTSLDRVSLKHGLTPQQTDAGWEQISQQGSAPPPLDPRLWLRVRDVQLIYSSSRTVVFDWIARNLVRSVSLRKKGNIRGARRIYKPSIDALFERFEAENRVAELPNSEHLKSSRESGTTPQSDHSTVRRDAL